MTDVQDRIKEAKAMLGGPGKFEGEPLETAYYWLCEDGESIAIWSDEDPDCEWEPMFDGELFTVDGEEDDLLGLKCGQYVIVWTDTQGFTMSKVFDSRTDVDKWVNSYLGLED